jgi:uncharacterized membrane protein YfcA
MILVGLLALFIGVTLGLLGGGGSILAVPVLAYAAGLEAKAAIATSLLVVGATALFALLPHAKKGNVDWRTGSVFALTAMAGAYGGGRLAHFFEGSTLLLLFAGMMIVTAVAMFRGRKDPVATTTSTKSAPVALIVLEGLVVGGATGLVGAGGGFLVVPALVLLGGMEMHRAVGTSLLVIALKSFSAFAGHAAHVSIDWQLAGLVTAAAVIGSFAGARIAHRIAAETLRKGFASFVLLMAAYVIWREAGTLPAVAALSVSAGFLAVMLRKKETRTTP